jgi:hypothetical protein
MYDTKIQMKKQNRHKTTANNRRLVERNRAGLDVKRRFELRYKKAFVNQ